MDEMEGSEDNAKVSDSAYSCNSQSRRSGSSKSTLSGSHSSRSSGYGGKPSVFSDKSGKAAEKKGKDSELKQKSQVQLDSEEEVDNKEKLTEPSDIEAVPEVADNNAEQAPQENKDSDVVREVSPEISNCSDENGFTCVISMLDGVVMYTTASLTALLGFPKDMWIGRSFIDFVHARDRNTFASHISSGFAVPKSVNATIKEAPSLENSSCDMVCRIRTYRGLSNGFKVKECPISFKPFLLKLSFKNVSDEEGNVTYLIVQATPFISAFKTPNEIVTRPIPFVLRHSANGVLEYIDPASVPYLGYLPQDLEGKNALSLYHPDDLSYLCYVYETIVKDGGMPRSKPYRMMTQNLQFIKVETEWSSFINPWTKKLEFVLGKHHIVEGPTNPEVFVSLDLELSRDQQDDPKVHCLRENIVRIMNEFKVLAKHAEIAKQKMAKQCQDISAFMQTLIEETPRPVAAEEEVIPEARDNSYYERDSVILGGISPHHDQDDSKSSVDTTLSYSQLNYNETLQRYFESHYIAQSPEAVDTNQGNILSLENFKSPLVTRSSMGPKSAASAEMSSSESGSGSIDGISSNLSMTHCHPLRLTETAITQHNIEMEKGFMKTRRDARFSTKNERKKYNRENKQKKKEHLARCNVIYPPTDADVDVHTTRGTKRGYKSVEPDTRTYKHYTTTVQRKSRKKQTTETVTSCAPDIPPTYYSAPAPSIPTTFELMRSTMTPNVMPSLYNVGIDESIRTSMYEQAIYGTPIMYSPFAPHDDTTTLRNTPINFPRNIRNFAESSNTAPHRDKKSSDETMDRTDGESSYSSFYSSFLRTESASAEESGDTKNTDKSGQQNSFFYKPPPRKHLQKRKMGLSCTEQVCWSSELIYKYQIAPKNIGDVLHSDRLKLVGLQQPALVNEQLGQLYLDLQLEGVAARLTLEEYVASSSSSGDDSNEKISKSRDKWDHSRLALVYEEDAPMPPGVAGTSRPSAPAHRRMRPPRHRRLV